jgi:hypothetical protein
MKLLSIEQIIQKHQDVPIYYRKEYSAHALFERMVHHHEQVELNFEFGIEMEPSGQKKIDIKILDEVDYPIMPITSPTYTLISEYHQGRLSLYHMDLYRIEDPEEFELLGAQELIYGQGICIIEWYQLIEDLLPEDLIIIDLQIEQDGSRTIRMNKDL